MWSAFVNYIVGICLFSKIQKIGLALLETTLNCTEIDKKKSRKELTMLLNAQN